jgi:hypothetical protein
MNKHIVMLVATVLGAALFKSSARAQGGVPLWTNFYNSPGPGTFPQAMAVDASGNVIVTGSGLDYATIKYSGAGSATWTNFYNGPGDNVDWARAMALDVDGNVIVTGDTSDGGLWHYGTVKYSSAGVPLWANLYSGPFNNDYAYALAVDGNDNVIVTGAVDKGDSSSDYATVKYSSAGVPLWTNLYNGPANDDDFPVAVATDRSNNVFVTGASLAIGGYFDYATIKYSSAGVPLWTRRYNGPGNGDDIPAAMAVDRDGNVFVTGQSLGSNGFFTATIAYSNAGVPLWTNRDVSGARAMVIDGSGNVFVGGGAIIKYSNAGVPLWTNNPWPASMVSIAVDTHGNVFATGSFDVYCVTIAYSGAGVLLWKNSYTGPAPYNNNTSGRAIAVDPSGNVFIAGTAEAVNNEACWMTIKFSAQPPVNSPLLEIQRAANGLILTWTNASFALQSAPNLTGTFTNVPGALSPFTNAIAGSQQYFRLKAN